MKKKTRGLEWLAQQTHGLGSDIMLKYSLILQQWDVIPFRLKVLTLNLILSKMLFMAQYIPMLALEELINVLLIVVSLEEAQLIGFYANEESVYTTSWNPTKVHPPTM